ncbi:hypothetical protein BH09VER1_BH09VER1_45750 [soil metagenome]
MSLAVLGWGIELNAEEVDALLKDLAEPPLTQAVQIDYQLTAVTEPPAYTPEQVEQKLDELRKVWPADASGLNEAVQAMHDTLLGRRESTSESRLVMGLDFAANRDADLSGPVRWTLRKGGDRYDLIEGQILVINHDPKVRTSTFCDLARRSLGLLGRLDAGTLRELSVGKPEVTRGNGTLTLKQGVLTVVLDTKGKEVRLHSIQRGQEAHQQKSRTVFEDYREMGGIVLPCKVTDSFETDESGRITRVYSVKKVSFGPDYEVPLINANFGFLQVQDGRFTPAVTYLAMDQLASEDAIGKWAEDPAALEEHNRAMDKMRGHR